MSDRLGIYARPRLIAILLLGFASGLPLALVGTTLTIRLTEAGISLHSIGAFALVGFAYSLKFLWSPLLDRLALPVLTRHLGRRRSWALAIEAGLIASILKLGWADPARDVDMTALWAVVVAFFSASQDIVIDAYRVELLAPEEQGPGAAATQIGYRVGLLMSGAGALYLATAFGWTVTYTVMAALILVGTVTLIVAPEPSVPTSAGLTGHWLRDTVIAPFADFARQPDWRWVLAFVLLYRLGDTIAGQFAAPFYLSLGFTKIEYASISKVFGIGATLIGVSVGGTVVYRWGVLPALLIGGLLNVAATLTYIVQGWAGHDPLMLMVTIGLENTAGGMASAAFVTYLSGLCSPAYTATQYALLSSLATLLPRFLGSTGGDIAHRYGWTPFFVLSAALILPALLLLPRLMRRPAQT